MMEFERRFYPRLLGAGERRISGAKADIYLKEYATASREREPNATSPGTNAGAVRLKSAELRQEHSASLRDELAAIRFV